MWQQVAYLAAAALVILAAAAFCVLALVALSPAWGAR